MLNKNSLKLLEDKKNLLAFSGGVDSTALFFLLKDANIKFDIAIVDYNIRAQSKEEVAYAQSLASQYNCKCHLLKAPQITNNFEAKAREIRYDFFNSLISEFSYENLLTAHHLGDRFEWMLMQFCKGAGCAELSSMRFIEEKSNYKLIRPLLHLEKEELQEYLNNNNIKYFIDESNLDQDIKRNYFRQTHTGPLLKQYLNGIRKSFEYIDDDAKNLILEVEIKHIQDFSYFISSNNTRSDIFTIDKHLKSIGFMMSAKERELLKINKTLVVGRKYIINWHLSFVFITPYDAKNINMTHEFKEKMRVLKIEPKLRTYFFTHLDVFESLDELLPLQ